MIIVCDTNVLISAFVFPGRIAEEVWRAVIQGDCVLAISKDILEEFKRILREKFQWPERKVARANKRVLANAELIEPKERFAIVKDPPDNRVLECAVKVNADYIVSGDKKHLQPLEDFRGIPIVSPGKLLEELEQV